MATRYRIGIEVPNKKGVVKRIRSIYVHNRGGAEDTEADLLAYTTREAVTALVGLGECSYIGPTLAECSPYNETPPALAITHPVDKWPATDAEYLYLFKQDGWYRAQWKLPNAQEDLERQHMQHPRLWEKMVPAPVAEVPT